ncbi:MAG: transposase, partial [Pirellulaceae bacterium]|nr:transposase [Pirellulaceae bacterium]
MRTTNQRHELRGICWFQKSDALNIRQINRKQNLHSVKAYLMREDFNRFWTYSSATWAGKFLREWCKRANQTN